jgi:hypothetical protein
VKDAVPFSGDVYHGMKTECHSSKAERIGFPATAVIAFEFGMRLTPRLRPMPIAWSSAKKLLAKRIGETRLGAHGNCRESFQVG